MSSVAGDVNLKTSETERQNGEINKESNISCLDSDVLAEIDALKAGGNKLFKSNRFEDAQVEYQKALEVCPDLDSSVKIKAILYANIAACYIQVKDYEKTIEYCTDALKLDERHEKARMRRIKANEQLDTMNSLQAACDDLNVLIDSRKTSGLDIQDLSKQLSILEPRLQTRQKAETEKVIGQLKDLGNGLLKNFGMSLDNFKLQDDGKGGYNVNFNK